MQFGLQSMQERAGQIGGSLQFQSTPGAGTRVVLEASGKEL
jgi:signal transduction histidine kinase